jgi:hypothetical protein
VSARRHLDTGRGLEAGITIGGGFSNAYRPFVPPGIGSPGRNPGHDPCGPLKKRRPKPAPKEQIELFDE